MRVLSTRTHGVLDYLVGVLLIAAPWLFNFARGGAETWVPVVLGTGTIIYSLFTNYELGISKQISMKAHLGIDTVSGILLAASPWIFGFSDYVYLPHLIAGILELGVVMLTDANPSHSLTGTSTTATHHPA